MQFKREKTIKKKKKAARACLKVYRKKDMKIHETKIPCPATKEGKCCFFMIAKPIAESLADR